MRLWSISPEYLDSKGLVALWREALLAKAVLQGKTKGYKNHPQLQRFKEQKDPVASINSYLFEVWKEACSRGFCFDKRKIGRKFAWKKIPVSKGQLAFEIKHLKKKLEKRNSKSLFRLPKIAEPCKMFKEVPGPKAKWEK